MSTYGETLVADLLNNLPTKEYWFIAEPNIASKRSAYNHPDFVIVSARVGVIVLEVKDWVQIREANQREIIIERRDKSTSTEINPIKTAREYALNLAERFEEIEALLKKHRGKMKLKFPWMYAVALPNIDSKTIQALEKKGIWGDGYIFGREDLTPARFQTYLTSIQPPWPLQKPLDSTTLDKIRGVLDPHLIISDSDDNPVGIETRRQTALIREPLILEPKKTSKNLQPALLPDDLLSGDAEEVVVNTSVRLVRGVAGSGKSLVLARRAQYLAEQNPDSKLLVLAYNVDLVRDLQRRISGAPNLEVTNFHKLCRSIANRKLSSRDIISLDNWLENNLSQHYLQSSGFSIDFLAQEIEWRKELEIYDGAQYLEVAREGRGKALSKDRRAVFNKIFDHYVHAHHTKALVDWSDVPRLALSELQQGHPMRNSYDIILIDEAQDFAPSWMLVVNKLLKTNGSLFLCDDPTQSLFRSFSWRQKGVSVVGKTKILRVPFRCTKEIIEAAYGLISGDETLSSSTDVTQPDLTSYEMITGETPTLANCRDLYQEVKMVEETALSMVNSGIQADQIAILCHSKRIVKHWAYLRDKGFYVETFNKMKGLEFQVVLLPHLNTAFDRHDMSKDEDFISEIRRKIFTGMTRARATLVMSYHGALPQELKPIEPFVQVEKRTDYGRVR